MKNVISFVITEENKEKLIKSYKKDQVDNPNQYVLFCAKTVEYSVTLWNSNKVVFQGSNFIDDARLFGYKEMTWIYTKDHIGSDEVGTGDFFGPIIVASAFVKESDLDYLLSVGINDSKKLSDDFIIKVVPSLLKKIPHKIMILTNEQYNNLHSEYNLNAFKAILHNNVLSTLSKENNCKEIVIDQFCSKEKYYSYLKDEKNVLENIHFEIKGESKSPAVAVASMIARYAFLSKINEINKKYNLNIPLGANKKVEEYAQKILNEKGIDFLKDIAKIDYKTLTKNR